MPWSAFVVMKLNVTLLIQPQDVLKVLPPPVPEITGDGRDCLPKIGL